MIIGLIILFDEPSLANQCTNEPFRLYRGGVDNLPAEASVSDCNESQVLLNQVLAESLTRLCRNLDARSGTENLLIHMNMVSNDGLFILRKNGEDQKNECIKTILLNSLESGMKRSLKTIKFDSDSIFLCKLMNKL